MSLENAKTQTCSGGSSTFERILLIKYLQPFGTAWKLPLSFWWAQYKHKQYDYTSHSASATGYSPARSPVITTQQNVTENDLNIHICSQTTISNAVDINCSWLGGGVIAFFLSNAPDFFLSRRESWVTLCLQTRICPHSSRSAAQAKCCQRCSGQSPTNN